MRIAVVNTPFGTHIGRTEFVLRGLHAKGHEVELWGNGETQAIAQRNGFTFREITLETDFSEVMRQPLQPHEVFNSLFFRMAKEQLGTVLDYCERYAPDVIEANARVFSATIASMLTGIPVVTHCCSGNSFSQLPEDLYGFCIKGDETPRQLAIMRKLNQEFFRETDEWFNEHIAVPFNLGPIENAIGICAPEYAVAQTIRELSKERIALLENVHLTGPVISESPCDVDFSRYRPYCYVSLGTSTWNISEIVDRYRALAGYIPRRLRVVIGLGGIVDTASLGITDDRVVVFERAPQIAAIEHSDFIVCHAGCQTVHEALYFGKPLIGIPPNAETSEMVNSVELNGAGVRVMPARVNDRTIASAIERITSSETMASARRVAELLRRADGYKNMIDLFDSIEMRLRVGR